MYNELFLAPASSQNLTSGFQGEKKIGAGGAGRSARTQSSVKPMNGEHQSFLATLEQASRDRGLQDAVAPAGRTRSSNGKEMAASGKLQGGVQPPGDGFDEVSAETALPENLADTETHPNLSFGDFAAIIDALEAMGFYQSAGGSDLQASAPAGQMEGPDLAAIKLLIGRIQQNQLVPSAELKAGFQRLQQFVATLLAGNMAAAPDGNPGNDFSPEQLSDLARIGEWLKALGAGLEVDKNVAGDLPGEGGSDEKYSATVAGGTRGADTPPVNPPEKTVNSKEAGIFSSPDHSGVASSAEDRKEADPAKFQNAAAFKNEVGDASSRKELQDVMPDARALSRTEDPNQMSAEADRGQRNGGEVKPESRSQTQSASAGEGPLSRLLQDSQPAKEGDFKVQTGISEEATGKVIKTEAGTNDSSLFNSAGQHAEKAAETLSAPKEGAAGSNNLPTQTLDQIVRKASIHLNSGQHEARIDLKPDFLGHVRMQVIAENHQVTLKILTEHGFVKDMIENNIHQLKADLQQQGMTIDKLHVAVSSDPDEFGNPKEKLFGSRSRQEAAARDRHERPADEKPKDSGRSFRRADGSVTVDYFA